MPNVKTPKCSRCGHAESSHSALGQKLCCGPAECNCPGFVDVIDLDCFEHSNVRVQVGWVWSEEDYKNFRERVENTPLP